MSRPTIGVASTFRDEHNALPGFLEMATSFFDAVFLADCSSDMSPSSDGSLDIIRQWGLPDPPLWDLSKGFGSVRSQLVHNSPTDWTVVMDIDERMFVTLPELTCLGAESYPDVAHPDLQVKAIGTFNHFERLVGAILEAERAGKKAVRFCRRHWFSPGFKEPTQNWTINRDYQLRCMKSRSGIGFTEIPRMHEHAWDFALNRDPEYVLDDALHGPFVEHYHCHFKKMEPDQRRADIATYDALHHSDTHTPIPA